MHMLVITPIYPIGSCGWGGIFVKRQVEALRGLGHRVDVVRVSHAHVWPISLLSKVRPEPETTEVDPQGNHFICIANRILPRMLVGPDWLFKLFHRRVNARMLETIEQLRPEVLHVHFGRSLGYADLALQRHGELPVVITTHGGGTRASRHNPFCRSIMRRAFQRADRVVAVSDKIRRDADAMNIGTDNFRIIGNGLPSEYVRPKADYWTPDCGRPLRLVTVCNLIPLKGTDDTLRAMRRLADRGIRTELRVVGTGPERSRLEQMARNLGLDDCLTFTGSLPHDEAMEEIYRADVYCMPSWNEGFGVVYVEAMGQGVPVIACRGQGIDTVVSESGAGLLVPGKDPDALAAALASFINNPAQITDMGRKGYDYARERLTWEAVARRLVALYEEVIAEKAQRENA